VKPRIPRRALLRFAALVGLLGGAFLLMRYGPVREHLQPERLLADLETLRGFWWSPLALLGLYLVISPLGLPVSPLLISGSVIFGAVWGSLYNYLGLMLGALVSFLLGRLLGRDLVLHLLGDRLKKVEKRIARRGFWPLVQLRLLPLPFVVLNVGAALSGISLPTFLGSTAIGLLPTTIIYTYFWSSLATSVSGARQEMVIRLVVAISLLFGLTMLPGLIRRRLRGKRLAELRSQRRQRLPL
jgi:uncharacterized membrane protein YdjX (TVP38/TMEM64 family)